MTGAVCWTDDAGAIRNNLRQLAADQLGEEMYREGRVEVLPIQWRKNLNLDVRNAFPPSSASAWTHLNVMRSTITGQIQCPLSSCVAR